MANGILHSKVGTVVKRYDIGEVYRDKPLTATHYGRAEFMFGVFCDVYVLSAGDKVAIKTDITEFLEVPLPTLNYHLSKHRDVIEPIQLDIDTIRSLGSTAQRMNGYLMDDVETHGCASVRMDSVIGIDLKRRTAVRLYVWIR